MELKVPKTGDKTKGPILLRVGCKENAVVVTGDVMKQLSIALKNRWTRTVYQAFSSRVNAPGCFFSKHEKGGIMKTVICLFRNDLRLHDNEVQSALTSCECCLFYIMITQSCLTFSELTKMSIINI